MDWPWFPAKGDALEASIRVTDWDWEGDCRSLPCGSFILDDFSFSGWPVTGTISAVSVPADSSFRETEQSKTWEDVTIQELAQEIAGRAGVTLVWDVEGGGPKLKSVEQTKRTDCEFLTGVCGDYGLVVKVYAKKLVAAMNEDIRLGKVSSLDPAAGLVRVVYHEKDGDVTRCIPILSTVFSGLYSLPEVGGPGAGAPPLQRFRGRGGAGPSLE